ncbi:hypothetical protein SAMN05216420_10295 [Nitrosospira sp. Nl5]|uniref:alkaline phosphatase PhoX n=1 Tax=Nitrosospira sp. Nl5 TaxID=200120 RepID=UPI00088DCD81|nr:alkaline phosphatase PhoX [Nitrosospira sp. Nl5]SCY04144.1 hypothetical protein SAMN05216420_10295 [Nitrosospira sp. Nl5]
MSTQINLHSLVCSSLLVVASATQATGASTDFDNYNALPNSVAAGSLPEARPFQLSSPLFRQFTLDANTPTRGRRRGDNWDMITANETGVDAGRYLFSPFETATAGVKRFDLRTNASVTIVAEGALDFVSGDASRWTPWGSYVTAEESWGAGSTKGRLFELTNPITTSGPATSNFVQRAIIPHVAHEGLAFDRNNNLYFIDEFNGGSIYKYISANPNASDGDSYFAAGQTFVMRVNGGGNANATGVITWAPITDINGAALANISVLNADGTIDGRASAKNASVTGYQRPEDIEIQTLPNGNQILYVATTETNEVYSFNLDNNTAKLFVSPASVDEATGHPVGEAFKSPDNIAIDAAGNIYIVEDQPGGSADIWLAKDENRDGVAESIGRWASMATIDAEPTGLYFDKFNPNVAYVNVQHTGSDMDRMIRIYVDHPIQISVASEAKTYTMMLAGLGTMAAVVRRRIVSAA